MLYQFISAFHLCVCVLVAQLCPTLCDAMDCNLPCSSVRGILHARILEWVAIPFSRGSSQPRYQTCVSFVSGDFFSSEPPGKPTFILTSDLLTVPISLPLPECRVIGIIQNVTFSDWHISV